MKQFFTCVAALLVSATLLFQEVPAPKISDNIFIPGIDFGKALAPHSPFFQRISESKFLIHPIFQLLSIICIFANRQHNTITFQYG